MPGSIIIDVRSESEFAEATIPGAFNLPLLNDQERAQVGTVYKQQSPASARRLGLNIVSPKLPALLEQLEGLARAGENLIFFCWRGGLRSQFVSHMFDILGFNVYRVNGGYKSYRKLVNLYLNNSMPHRAVVLHGLTGTGKTDILEKLEEMGLPVLDLERLSCHRGSVFGKVGMPPSPSQKMFEAQVMQKLKACEGLGVFIVECESRRMGRLLVPPAVMEAMKIGCRVLVYAPLEERIKRTLEIYTGPCDVRPMLQDAVGSLVKYIGKARVESFQEKLARGDYYEVTRFLLTDYYDPLYKYPDCPSVEYDISVDTSNTDKAAAAIKSFVQSLPEYGVPAGVPEIGGEADGNRQYPEGCPDCPGDFSGHRGGAH